MRNRVRRTWRQIGRALLSAGAVVVVATAAIACSGPGDSQQTEAEVNWIELLEHVPDTQSTRQSIMIGDFARARAVLGIDRPPSEASESVLAAYADALLIGDGLGTGFSGGSFLNVVLMEPGSIRSELGFAFADIDQYVVGSADPGTYTIWRGRFDADEIADAVHADPVFSDLLEEESHEGVSYYSWGGDNEQHFERVTALRRLGRGHRLAINGSVAYWSTTTQPLLEMIDASTGASASLADREDYQLLAAGLDELKVFAGSLSTEASHQLADPETLCLFDCTAEAVAEIEEFLEGEPLLVPYRAFASGTGIDDSGRFSAVVIVHDDDASARENVNRLSERIENGHSVYYRVPWTEEFFPDKPPPEDYLDVSSDGRVLTAKIYSEDANLWSRWTFSIYALLLWED